MLQSPTPRRSAGFPLLEIAGSVMLLAAVLIFVLQLGGFSSERQQLPAGLELGGVPVGGLSRTEAQAYVEEIYGGPISVTYRDQELHLYPDQVGFRVNSGAMLSQADQVRTEGTFWPGFWDYLWLRPEQAYAIDLQYEYSEDLLQAWVDDVSTRYDRSAEDASIDIATLSVSEGTSGYTLDKETAVALLSDALQRPLNRSVNLPTNEESASRPDMEVLQQIVVEYLVDTGFLGVTSVHVIDLETGEEMQMDLDLRDEGNPQMTGCEISYSGTSMMKVGIMSQYFGYLYDLPLPYELEKVEITMVQSGNWSANSMILDIGYQDMENGVNIVRNGFQELGLENSFVVAGYDEEEDPQYFSTPAREAARSGDCINTFADPYMQTTTTDMAGLLNMIYECAEFGGGGLMAYYPESMTQADCELMLSIMKENYEGQLIRAGVPEGVDVAHKHGWDLNQHGDSGIVFSPGGDYVLVVVMWANVDWLAAPLTFPIIQGISEATFNYFNPDMIDVPRQGLNLEVDSSISGEDTTDTP